ncbi:AraC family transcriptional regulator with amidase-like domain [Paraburkholderia sp. BL6665CI2N2]|uniref:GlxA family transcriptional regulator n=1 Tax=Paraburkholderia sp. BL6665CI2N2 TaxID=1938806 RepID=UPI001064A72B|nr:helix-turn-helix domain-containing protein [Paraburkholderia sp. BL6665CI2N2]TDY16960.1 AraC family transcriptional regulator with amidase-like domain [Paraburkholderia sp. BL6665CI2N2]
MKTVAILALHGVVPFDLGIACDIFSRVRTVDGDEAYRVLVCGESSRIRAGHFDIHTPWRLEQMLDANILIIPGVENINIVVSSAVKKALRLASDRGALVASICTGAFILASTGLLDGRRATTHWAVVDEFANRFPAVTVDPDVLFVDEGNVVTSAGSSAGLDMCFHLIGRCHGQAVASHAARLAVAPLFRDGGQAQFIQQTALPTSSSLVPLLEWMLGNLDQPIDVTLLASRASMTPRTFARRFRDQTGTTPIQWLLRSRVRRAQELLETTSASVDQVSVAVGFDSPVTFRARFRSVVGLTPSSYRRRFSSASLSTQAD